MRIRTLALALALAAPLPAAAQTLTVSLDQALRVSLPRPARDVIVGNPAIADANVLDDRHLILIGKSVGVTNLMVTDREGRVMVSREVVIDRADANRVVIYRGPDSVSYACAARCERNAAAAGGPQAPQAPPAQ